MLSKLLGSGNFTAKQHLHFFQLLALVKTGQFLNVIVRKLTVWKTTKVRTKSVFLKALLACIRYRGRECMTSGYAAG